MVKRLKNPCEILSLLLIDLILITVAIHLSTYIRVHVLPLLYSGFPPELPFKSLLDIWWIFPVWIFFLYYEGLYGNQFSFWDETKASWNSIFFSTIGVFIIVSVGRLSEEISRTVTVLMGIFSFIILPFGRITLKRILKNAGLFKRKVLIIGAGETGALVAKAVRKEPNYGYEIVGFLDDDIENAGKIIDGIKVYSGINMIDDYIKDMDINGIFIAIPQMERDRLTKLINDLQHKVEKVFFVPEMRGIAVLNTRLRSFFHEQTFIFEIQNNLSRPLNIFIKRCFDLFASAVLLPLLIVPMIAIAILIKIDSEGPVIFSQERVGKGGRRFRCLKFRTMYIDAEQRLSQLLQRDPLAKEEYEKYWKLKNDPRVTRVGRFLRETSLDELPQIFNSIKGEMSIVGPRPYMPSEVESVGEIMETCFYVPPGITGLWQVSGRSDMSYDYRIALDLWYVRNWNLWLDIVILFKTIRVVVKREGAR